MRQVALLILVLKHHCSILLIMKFSLEASFIRFMSNKGTHNSKLFYVLLFNRCESLISLVDEGGSTSSYYRFYCCLTTIDRQMAEIHPYHSKIRMIKTKSCSLTMHSIVKPKGWDKQKILVHFTFESRSILEFKRSSESA